MLTDRAIGKLQANLARLLAAGTVKYARPIIEISNGQLTVTLRYAESNLAANIKAFILKWVTDRKYLILSSVYEDGVYDWATQYYKPSRHIIRISLDNSTA